MRLALDFITTLRSGDIEWRQRKLQEISELKKQSRIYDIQVDHEINSIKAKFAEEIIRVREKEARITQDYKDFLNSIDEMKEKIIGTFTDMPKPMAYIMHNHARQLIDNMWNNSDKKCQEICKARLAEFFMIVYDDTSKAIIGQGKIPEKTLQLIIGNN
jgi:hypothetical protein